jgi:hypothetical protein
MIQVEKDHMKLINKKLNKNKNKWFYYLNKTWHKLSMKWNKNNLNCRDGNKNLTAPSRLSNKCVTSHKSCKLWHQRSLASHHFRALKSLNKVWCVHNLTMQKSN